MKKLLLITLICILASWLLADGSPRFYTQILQNQTTGDGQLPGVTNTSATTAPGYHLTAYIVARPGEVISTNAALDTDGAAGASPATAVRIWRFGNGTTVPYASEAGVQLSLFDTPWAAGDVLHCIVQYIATGETTAWDLTIPAGTAAINYNTVATSLAGGITPPVCAPFPIPTNPPNPAVYVAPANGAIGLGYAGQVLSWGPGVGGGAPTGYRVYFGTDNPPMTQVADQVPTTWPTGVLAQNTTYYWQIVPYNADGPAVGNAVWSFTTRGEMNPNPAENPVPANGAVFASPVPGGFVQTISWSAPSSGVTPTGYKLAYMGVPPIDIGNVLSTTVLINGPGVITWQIIPYYIDGGMRKVEMKPIESTLGSNRTSGVRGDAVGCPVWTFTVTDYVPAQYAVNVTSTPAGAAIYEGVVNTGFVTPHTFYLVEHTGATYSVQMPGYTWAPVDYTVTDITAPVDINFVGTLIEYQVMIDSTPAGAAILVNGLPSGFVTPHPFMMGYGTSAIYTVQLPQYIWAPTEFAVNNITAPTGVMFLGTFVPNMYNYTINSTPPGAVITVDGTPSAFITPHTFQLVQGANANYSVALPGFTFAPVLHQVTNIQANGSFTFVGTAITYSVTVNSLPAGALISENGGARTFICPHVFEAKPYGSSWTYDVILPGYTFDGPFTVGPLYDDAVVNFTGTINQYPVDITSAPAGAAIYVDGVDSGFITPHQFMMNYGTGATYTVQLPGYIFVPVSYVVTNITGPLAQNFVGMGVDGMIEPGIPEFMQPPAGVGIPGVVFLDPPTTGFNIDYFIYTVAGMPILPANPGCDNTNTYGVVLSHTGGTVDMEVQVPAGIWYVTGYWGGMWHEAVAYPYVGTVPGYVTLFGIDFGARADVPIYISQMNPNVPVELQSFTAVVTAANFVNLTWVTASETQALGFNIYRSDNDNVADAYKVNTTIIPATNTSQTHTYNMIDDEDLVVGNTYYYWLESVDMTGYSVMSNGINVTITGGGTPELPELSVMSNAYPNPFRAGGSTNINVEIKEGEAGTVTIYNLLGQIVKTYNVTEGQHSLTWNANGCASGIYFYKLSTPTTNSTKKLVIVN